MNSKKRYFERVASKNVLAVGQRKLAAAFTQIQSDWQTHLKPHKIKLPQQHSNRWYQLAILKHFQGLAVHKNDISRLIEKLTGKPATDQQVRHLKTQQGWFVLNKGDSLTIDGGEFFTPEGCHVLISTCEISSHSVLQRRRIISGGDWAHILAAYDNTCASCGTKIGEYHRFDASYKVEVLEKGHMNPRKPLAPGNIIPQCHWCNKTARSDFTFDEQGRPRAVAGIRPIKRADPEVRKEIKKWLHKETD